MAARTLEIRLFGELEVLRSGRRVALPASKKSRALLGYFVATGRSHGRESLCELLWEVPDDPRAALRWCLTKIRPLVDDEGEPRLLADRERVSFERKGARIDLWTVRELLGERGAENASIETLEAAAKAQRGELLEGLELPDCYRYNAWWIGERESARKQRLQVLDVLLSRLEADPERALPIARARIGIDPLSEAGHLVVVQILGRLGRSKEGLAQYDSYKRILDQELKARPSPEMERARLALGQEPARLEPRAKPSTPISTPGAAPIEPAPDARDQLPLCGRDAELAHIDRFLSRSSGLLLFSGEPGIGKSRLIGELAQRVRAGGGRVFGARAFEAEMVRPYGIWIDALRSGVLPELDAELKAGLSPLLPELGSGSNHAFADKQRMFDSVARLLAQLAAAPGGCLILLDDIHWLDEASGALLHYVAREQSQAAGLRFGLGARAGELPDNPAALRLVRALARDKRLDTIELGPLPAAALAKLVHTIDARVDAGRVGDDCGGNPFFAIEVARARAVDQRAGSSTLDALLDERLSRLSSAALELMPWAAALGRSFDAELLAAASGTSAELLIAAMEDLERHGVITAKGGAYDFNHDLVRQAAYRRLSAPRRKLVHIKIARTLDQLLVSKDAALAGDVAHHAGLGGDDQLAATACVQAATRCQGLYAFAEAAELALKGLRHAERLPDQLRITLQARLLQAQLGPRMPKQGPLVKEAARLQQEAETLGMGSAAADLASFQLFATYMSGDMEAAFSAAQACIKASRVSDPRIGVISLSHSAACLVELERDLDQAKEIMLEAQTIAARAQVDVMEVAWATGGIAAYEGRLDLALPLLDRAAAKVGSDGNPWPTWNARAQLMRMLLEQGRYDDVLARCEKLVEIAAKLGEGAHAPFSLCLNALAQMGLGRAGASEALASALDELDRANGLAYSAYARCMAARFELEHGRTEAAEALATRASAEARQVHREGDRVGAELTLAEIELLRGDRAAAERRFLAQRASLQQPHLVREAIHAQGRVLAEKLSLPI